MEKIIKNVTFLNNIENIGDKMYDQHLNDIFIFIEMYISDFENSAYLSAYGKFLMKRIIEGKCFLPIVYKQLLNNNIYKSTSLYDHLHNVLILNQNKITNEAFIFLTSTNFLFKNNFPSTNHGITQIKTKLHSMCNGENLSNDELDLCSCFNDKLFDENVGTYLNEVCNLIDDDLDRHFCESESKILKDPSLRKCSFDKCRVHRGSKIFRTTLCPNNNFTKCNVNVSNSIVRGSINVDCILDRYMPNPNPNPTPTTTDNPNPNPNPNPTTTDNPNPNPNPTNTAKIFFIFLLLIVFLITLFFWSNHV